MAISSPGVGSGFGRQQHRDPTGRDREAAVDKPANQGEYAANSAVALWNDQIAGGGPARCFHRAADNGEFLDSADGYVIACCGDSQCNQQRLGCQLFRGRNTPGSSANGSSQSLTAGAPIGAGSGTGKLTIQLGSWGSGGAGPFTPGSSAAVDVDVNETDSYATIAAAINAKNAGVTATVLKNGTTERLSIRSTTTGADAGFTITSDSGFAALDSLSLRH